MIFIILMYNSITPLGGKVALITGGSGGIGLAYTKHLIQAGLKNVVIVDINENSGNKTVHEIGVDRVFFIKADVTKDEQLENAFKEVISKFGRIDIVINNAGIAREDQIDEMIAINAISVVKGTYLAFKYMGRNNGGEGGVVVNTSSIYGLTKGTLLPVYTATKHFLIAFGRAIGEQFYYNQTGVEVITICPGITRTDMIKNVKFPENFLDLDEMIKEESKKMGEPKSPDNVGKGLIKILKNLKSGSVWLVDNGEEAIEIEIPNIINKIK